MISINNKQLDGLCYDFEYQVTDKDELANKICQLILGNCGHVSKVINGLASNPREVDKKAVDFLNQIQLLYIMVICCQKSVLSRSIISKARTA